jgi:hypothetical protein
MSDIEPEVRTEKKPIQDLAAEVKHIYIGEKPKDIDDDNGHISVQSRDNDEEADIKVVNIHDKDNALGDRVHKKNSLLAIKQKVKSQIFVEKRESNRKFGGASFF